MGSLTWKSSLPGNWSAASSWSVIAGASSVPGFFDDVTINAPLNYVVTVDGNQFVHDLTLNGSGARLAVSGTLTLGGTLVAQSGSLAISGDLLGGTVDLAGATYSLNGSLLVQTTWIGPVVLNGTVSVFDGFTAFATDGSSPGDVTVGVLTDLDANGTLDNALLHLGSGAVVQELPGATLTLGSSLTVLVQANKGAAYLGYGGTAINRGTVEVASTIGGIRLAPGFTNDGVMTLGNSGGSAITADGTLFNNGVLDVTNYNSSIVYGDLVNSGTLIAGSGPFGGTLSSLRLSGPQRPLAFRRAHL